MTGIDLLLIGGVLAFVLLGFSTGMIQTFGSLVGVFAGAYVSGHIFEKMGHLFSFVFLGKENLSKLVMFLAIFILVNRLVGILFGLVNLAFKFVSIVPFVKTFNRLGGAVLGILEGIFAISMFLYIALRFPLGVGMVQAITDSPVAKGLLVAAKILTPLLPDALQKML